MKYEVTTLNTKKALSASLKKFMEMKPLSKITVTEIIADCQLNRKTFYYHFTDIYNLLKWTLEQEAVNVVKQFDLITDYEEAINFVIDYVNENKHIINCAYDSMGKEEMKRFFYNDFFDIVNTVVSGGEKQLKVTLEEDFKKFLCALYTEALAGILTDWFKDQTVRDRKKLVEYLTHILCASLPEVIKTGAKAKL